MDENEELKTLLRTTAVFCDFDDSALDIIAPCVSTVAFDVDEYIIRDGQSADLFYVVHKGTVMIEMALPPSRCVGLYTLVETDVIGGSWLAPPYRWNFDARAVSQVEAIEFDARRLRTLCQQNHDFGLMMSRRFMSVMESRLTAVHLQLLNMYVPRSATNVFQDA